MDLEEFIVDLFPERLEDIVVHYKGEKYSAISEPSISDVLEELIIDAKVSGDLDIILEVPLKGKFFRRRISLQEVSPLALPQEQRPDMPNVRVLFNPVTLAPEQLLLQDNFPLPVVSWESVSVKIQNQWPPIDSSYGIPFGSYKIEVGLPELPNLRKKTAKILLTLSPDINLGLSSIKSGLFAWDYSRFSWSIEEVEPEAFGVFQLIMDQLKNEQAKKLDALFAKEFAEYQRTGILADTDSSSILEQTRTEDHHGEVHCIGVLPGKIGMKCRWS